MKRAIVKRNLEAFDGTKIKQGEVVDITYPLGFEPSIGRVTVSIGRRYIQCVDIKDLEIKA